MKQKIKKGLAGLTASVLIGTGLAGFFGCANKYHGKIPANFKIEQKVQSDTIPTDTICAYVIQGNYGQPYLVSKDDAWIIHNDGRMQKSIYHPQLSEIAKKTLETAGFLTTTFNRKNFINQNNYYELSRTENGTEYWARLIDVDENRLPQKELLPTLTKTNYLTDSLIVSQKDSNGTTVIQNYGLDEPEKITFLDEYGNFKYELSDSLAKDNKDVLKIYGTILDKLSGKDIK
ncbi:MAG: hypothetical protein ACOYT4_02380 [Nanoarchaeota archaeon]